MEDVRSLDNVEGGAHGESLRFFKIMSGSFISVHILLHRQRNTKYIKTRFLLNLRWIECHLWIIFFFQSTSSFLSLSLSLCVLLCVYHNGFAIDIRMFQHYSSPNTPRADQSMDFDLEVIEEEVIFFPHHCPLSVLCPITKTHSASDEMGDYLPFLNLDIVIAPTAAPTDECLASSQTNVNWFDLVCYVIAFVSHGTVDWSF